MRVVRRLSSLRPFVYGFWLLAIVTSCKEKERTPGNFLSGAASPYLREHADNPVNWYEWGDDALEEAKEEGKPLLISIGYAACHWCHVMEEESFMDSAVAKIMNERFVCIKVDREQRPDIDQVYINAASIMSGNTGWPLNAFTLPDGQPFHTATYVPKKQWIEMLNKVADAYNNERTSLEERAKKIKGEVVSADPLFQIAPDERPFTSKSVSEQIELWLPEIDPKNGGLNGAPKFPLPVIGEMLLQHHYLTNHQASLALIKTQLDAMANGAINDHLGGGFARYTVDEEWKTPHFEKMLYDNGQLISLYAHAYQLTKDKRYLEVLKGIVHFIDSELGPPLYEAAVNAASEGEEGKYYKWTAAEIESILPPEDVVLALEYFGISKTEGTTATTLSIQPTKENTRYQTRILNIKQKLHNARLARKYPGRDKTIITSWNAMVIDGLVEASKATGDPDYLIMAVDAAQHLEREMIRAQDQALLRSRFDDKPGGIGFLEDYAWTAKAFVNLYQTTFNIHWLERATQLTEHAMLLFNNPASEFLFYSADEITNPVNRSTEIFDNVIPSSNTIVAEVLFKLGILSDRSEWVSHSKAMVTKALTADPGQGIHLAGWARLAEMIASDPYEVAIMGRGANPRQLQKEYLPTAVFLGGHIENLPLLENKLVEGKTMYYVCRNKVCKLPTEDPLEALQQLQVKK